VEKWLFWAGISFAHDLFIALLQITWRQEHFAALVA
jgi:hypothetical protein